MCVKGMKTATKILRMISPGFDSPKRKITTKGKAKLPRMDDRETYLVITRMMIKIPRTTNKAKGYRAIPTPARVPTPLPPLNPAKTGKT